jgi:hypothetical protein
MKEGIMAVAVGVGIGIGLNLFPDAMTSVNNFTSNITSSWMSGKDLINPEDRDLPESKAFVAAFDKDNGKVYCVPKMNDAELGEFKTRLPGIMIENIFGGVLLGQRASEFQKDKPIESILRMSLTKEFPCK